MANRKESPTIKPSLSILHGPAQPAPIHKTFSRLLREKALSQPSSLLVASDHQQKSLSYAEADSRSDDLARGLAALGAKQGDRIAILMGNEIEYIETFFACTKLGAPVTLANYAYTEQELHSVLSSCGVSMLVMVPRFDRYDYRAWIPNLKRGIPSLQNIVVVNADKEPTLVKLDYTDYEAVVLRGRSNTSLDLLALEANIHARDVMNLQFTSGSTGLPKASALTHSGIYNAGRYIGSTMYLQPSDRICLPVPLFHSFGLIIGLAVATAYGASLILPASIFDAEATLACIPKYRCTGLYGVTTMFVAEMAHPRFGDFDLSSLRFAILSGSAVPEPLMRKVWAAFGITQTHTNWGLTEASSIVTMTRDTDSMAQRTVTSGRLFPGFSARIADPSTGQTVPRGQRGEIALRGNGIQAGYYGNPQRTAEAHRISPEDGLEWFHTGDEGYFDPDGFFVITGRIKDMIIRGGENISPLEIEERLVAHPSIAQASVIGVPDAKYGEQICAFVEPTAGTQRPLDDELRAWVAETLAHFKRPRYIVWLGSHAAFQAWPKTASGKLRKPDLRLIAAEMMKGAVEEVREQEPVRARL
ncbi:hypothetical protein TRIATDRAFT_211606 [Trichoderma atroviride IMI 206040]|uniref:Uncharacterized protein n=1 Tax=Hypocrea atroviridis (strain ATCC 20476 / IMI 206040) TaxID=452589 RepID=G9NG62_HYPAI|nr:uncharacterized protein TRIATDRAFT_211606 [Trichoderma atroviride IMI 206040]EHK50274.1 hypothetical protein TRIATDRAFT_211606 [Trichoderma atroviride IMI 206040]